VYVCCENPENVKKMLLVLLQEGLAVLAESQFTKKYNKREKRLRFRLESFSIFKVGIKYQAGGSLP